MLIAVLAVSTSMSWTLTWSDDRAFACAAILIFACGLTAGSRWPLSRYLSQVELAVMSCTWTLLQPWLIAFVVLSMRFVPASLLEQEASRLPVGLVCAIPTWFIAGWLWSSLVVGNCRLAANRNWNGVSANLGLSAGVVLGLIICPFVLAPWIGAWCTCAIATVLVIASRLIPWCRDDAQTAETAAASEDSAPLAAFDKPFPGWWTSALEATAAVAVGGLMAAVFRLIGQLIPNGAQVLFSEWIGLAIGLGIGQCLRANRVSAQKRSVWFRLAPAAAAALLLALMPLIVTACLAATASMTMVGFLMAFRVILLAGATVPLGFALADLLPAGSSNPVSSASGVASRESSLTWWNAIPVACGFVAAQFGFESFGPVAMMSFHAVALVLVGFCTVAVSRRNAGGRTSRLGMAGMCCCALMGLSIPLWRANDNPITITKLLFSTPSFVAHRTGWESRLLPMLDDARVIDVREGIQGPLTLWRSHGMELHLRENGIPRSIISAKIETHPQFAPEVLQAIFPIVLSQHPNRILLLGASGGVPLTTCLRFPVQEVICAESDRPLMDIVRGPIARETGYDPFQDPRVQVVTIPPAIAVMSRPETYDVILSSPPPSSIVAGAAMFTVDHYRHAARRLATDGIFCQRLQCVDYGADPFRTVVQSMRKAFEEVIAIETAAGEFLLLGANSPGAFVAGDLPSRLKAPHVRRLLADSSLDWSTLLNFPAYDDAALGEICAEGRAWTNAPANGLLALRAPLELVRWGAKLQEVQQILNTERTSPASYLSGELAAKVAQGELKLTRKSRMLEWLDDRQVTPELLRRLSEVAVQHKVVRQNPDSEFHSWEYRTALREQLQSHRPSAVQKVSHVDHENASVHPEDQRRQAYFVALGKAAEKPTAERIESVAAFLQPYDPLVSYFARLEIAELQSRDGIDPTAEFARRLHSIYFAPVADASTKNLAATLELLVQHPEILSDPVDRYDMLNGLIQTLRTHWESRQAYPVKSARRRLADVDRSLVAVEKAISAMNTLHASADVSSADWEIRKQVIDRLLVRPLHSCREQLHAAANQSERRTRSMIDSAEAPDKKNAR